jgi:hypothetical protein
MRNLPVGLIRCKIQLIFADNAIVPTAGCGGVTPPAKTPGGTPALRRVRFNLKTAVEGQSSARREG